LIQGHDGLAAGWTAATRTNRYAGLWPTKQAAAEVLVKQAGYELERS
jgi:prophage tail gpP-like protein